jgi:hypothetical protein
LKNLSENSRTVLESTGSPHFQILNINNLWTWAESNGESNSSHKGDCGTYFPRGTSWVIYKDGIKWGGKCYVDEALTIPAPFGQIIRVGGCDYGNGTRPGRIVGFGATAVRADPEDPDVRMYRIRRDYASMSDDELAQDAAESFEIPIEQVTPTQMGMIYDQYEKDWLEWPVEQGAPFIDRNRNGEYDPPPLFDELFTVDSLIEQGHDEPGLAGANLNIPADQVLWNVYNDLDRDRTWAMEDSEPIGLELQRTIWGYNRTSPVGDMVFHRLRIINKGGVDIDDAGNKGCFWIDSMYVGIWSDPNLGDPMDDLAGCDTTLDIGYVYNSKGNDREYSKFDLPPPAAGYVLLQGALIPAAGQVGMFNMQFRSDYANLPMTSFLIKYSSAINGYENRITWYKALRGFYPVFGADQYHPFPPGMDPGPFIFSGDPIKGTGFLDGLGEDYSFSPGDRRMVMGSGPFTMAPGDTQEVVYALVCALGTDRLSSLSKMKYNAKWARTIAHSFFDFEFEEDVQPAQSMLPEDFMLYQNYPNPFNSETTFQFDLPVQRKVRMYVYNTVGQLVNILMEGPQEAGFYTIIWDGTDLDGNRVPTGVYFCYLEAGGYVKTRKMLLVE